MKAYQNNLSMTQDEEDNLFSDLHELDNYQEKNFSGHGHPMILERLAERMSARTPDFHQLKLRREHPVFVYGTLRAGQRLHEVLKDCPTLGDGVTVATDNEMFTYTAGNYPVVLPQPDKDKDFAAIYGEIYVVPPQAFLELDQIEANNHLYHRQQKMVWCLDQTVKEGKRLRPAVKCWMYIGNPAYWEGVVNMRKVHTLDFSSDKILGKTNKIYDWLKASY